MRNHKFAAATLICMTFCAVAAPSAAHNNNNNNDIPSDIQLLPEFRPIGGTGNNLVHPELDVVPGNAELNLAPLNFASGTQNGLINGPNPRTISNVICGGTSADGDNGQTDDAVASAWLYVFGQFLDHDISLESTPQTSASINITIPDGDPTFPQGSSIVLNRDVRDPKTNNIINTVAGYIDLSQLYGSTTAVASSLRNADGSLMSTGNGLYLPIVNNNFVTGDVRVMENPELTAVTTLFMREHNFWVATLKTQHPHWTGDQLYNMAKAITTAEYQNVVYTEYLPLLIGNVLGPYNGYNPHVNAQVTQEFSTVAFRVGHSQVSDTQVGLDANGNVVFTEPLAQAFFNTPAQDIANGFNPLIRHIGADYSQATDVYAVATLRNLLTAGLVGGDVDTIDLMAIDIQRERDVGTASLNETRKALGLAPYKSFAQLTRDSNLQGYFQTVYGNINNVDLFIGGLAESPSSGSPLVGPTFQTIIADQFQRLREGDRFFWMNQDFDQKTAEMISHTTLAQIIERNTDITGEQNNVFLAVPINPPAAGVATGTPPSGKLHSLTSSVDTQGRPLPAPFTQRQ